MVQANNYEEPSNDESSDNYVDKDDKRENNSSEHKTTSILNKVADVSNGAGYLSGGVATIQLDMLNNSFEINALYKFLGKSGKFLGYASYPAVPISITLDYKSMQKGEINKETFSYRTTGTVASVVGGYIAGASLGGPAGLVAGAAIGGAFVLGEKAYKGLKYLWSEISGEISNIENNIKLGSCIGR